MARYDAFVHQGKRYDREGFRELLRQQMDAARSDREHPYNNREHPQHQAAVADMRNAYRWLAGEMDDAEEYEIGGAVNAALQGESEVATSEKMAPELQAVKEMNRIISTAEGRTALQRAGLGLPLSKEQAQLWEVYKELEDGVNTVARQEQHSKGGTMKIHPRPALGADVMPWMTNPHREQRRQLAADWKNKTLANPDHDYWHPERGALNKSAKLAMKAAYEMGDKGEVTSVQINPATGASARNRPY
jgi:hypothetical protein